MGRGYGLGLQSGGAGRTARRRRKKNLEVRICCKGGVFKLASRKHHKGKLFAIEDALFLLSLASAAALVPLGGLSGGDAMHRVIPLLLGGGSRQVICWKSQRWQKPFFDLTLLKAWRQWFIHKKFLNVRNRLSPAWPRGEEEYFVDDGGESLEEQGRVHQVLRRAPETSAVEV